MSKTMLYLQRHWATLNDPSGVLEFSTFDDTVAVGDDVAVKDGDALFQGKVIEVTPRTDEIRTIPLYTITVRLIMPSEGGYLA